jgi:hypothetical protein
MLNQGEVAESGDRQGEQFDGDVVAEFAASDSFSEDRLEFADERRLRPVGYVNSVKAFCRETVGAQPVTSARCARSRAR